MKSLLSFLLLSSILVFSACKSRYEEESLEGLDELMEALEEIEEEDYEDEWQTVNTFDMFEMEVPGDMEETYDLNDDAMMQYDNLFKEKYVVVIVEDKDDFMERMKDESVYDAGISDLENFAEYFVDDMHTRFDVVNESYMSEDVINGHDAFTVAIDAEVYGIPEPLSYWMAFIEGEYSFYLINAWTLRSRKWEFEDEANDMIESFREL